MDYKVKYFKLKQKFKALQNRHTQTIDTNASLLKQISQLKLENNLIKAKNTQQSKPNPSEQSFANFARTIVSKQYATMDAKRFSPIKPAIQDDPDDLDFTPAEEGKIDQIFLQGFHPVRASEPDPILMQAFLLVGLSNKSLHSSSPVAQILYEYPHRASALTESVRAVIPDFCFPHGIQTRLCQVNDTETQVKELIEQSSPIQRNNNFYIFTLKSEKSRLSVIKDEHFNDTLYVVCVTVEELWAQSNSECIVPQCYCIISYIPVFQLHYAILTDLLSIRKKKRLEEVNQGIWSRKLNEYSSALFSQQEIALLRNYFYVDHFGRDTVLRVQNVTYTSPSDLSLIDVEWLCCPFFSVLKMYDVIYILSAALQEKSIVFVSYNLGLVSSCVLALQTLMRPFQWPNILLPIMPEKLEELLDAPVPFLAGFVGRPTNYRKYPNIIWVMLDQPSMIRRVQGHPAIVNSVQEIQSRNIRKSLREVFGIFREETKFQWTLMQRGAALAVYKVFYDYLSGILRSCNVGSSRRIHRRIVGALHIEEDKAFVKAFC